MTRRLAQSARHRLAARLPRRTVRLRLTAVYLALFLASGAGLLTITYLLVENHSQLPTMTSIRGASAQPGASQLPSVSPPAGSGVGTGSGVPGGSGLPGGAADSQVCVSTGQPAPTTSQQLRP